MCRSNKTNLCGRIRQWTGKGVMAADSKPRFRHKESGKEIYHFVSPAPLLRAKLQAVTSHCSRIVTTLTRGVPGCHFSLLNCNDLNKRSRKVIAGSKLCQALLSTCDINAALCTALLRNLSSCNHGVPPMVLDCIHIPLHQQKGNICAAGSIARHDLLLMASLSLSADTCGCA